jgi:hypothetical protein
MKDIDTIAKNDKWMRNSRINESEVRTISNDSNIKNINIKKSN